MAAVTWTLILKLVKKYPCEDWFYIRQLWILQEVKSKKQKPSHKQLNLYIF